MALRESTSICHLLRNSSGKVILLAYTQPAPGGTGQLEQHLSGLHVPHHAGCNACDYPLKGPGDTRLPPDHVPLLAGKGEDREMFSIRCGDAPGETHGNRTCSDLLHPTEEGLHVPNTS